MENWVKAERVEKQKGKWDGSCTAQVLVKRSLSTTENAAAPRQVNLLANIGDQMPERRLICDSSSSL